ncbi:MAG: MBL fold metallo-hydrolase [Ruminococcaceae bacterium]|nr:MBL fold metallo-hydrolase [Oscillospiraceae bacterium]
MKPVFRIALLMLCACLILPLIACTTEQAPEQQTTQQDSRQTNALQDSAEQTQPEQESTEQESSEQDSSEQPTQPPEPIEALTPEQVVRKLSSDAKIMQTGSSTYQAILSCDWDTASAAFIQAGYAQLKAPQITATKLDTQVLCAKDYTVTLQKTRDNLYAVWEPYCEQTLALLFPNDATGTGEVTLAQIGIERTDQTDNPMNGMCYVYKLSDGSAVVIDGGFNTKACRDNIWNALQKLDIAKTEDGRYRITAWILSHGHKDHRAALTGFGNNYGAQVALSYVFYNIPVSPGPLTASTFKLLEFEEKLANNFPDAQHVVPHAGLQYHFGNLTVQVLYSPEMMYQPNSAISYYNDTSLIFVAECSGTRTLYMGDAGENAATKTWFAYGKAAFAADMLQITHHGFNTGDASHTWQYLKNIYSATKATHGLLPMGSRLEGDARNGRYTVLIGHGAANYQISIFVNENDKHDQKYVSQEYYNAFVDSVAAGTNTQATLFGYDGINKIVSETGMVTYAMGNETEAMVTLFTLGANGVNVTLNQVLADWLE